MDDVVSSSILFEDNFPLMSLWHVRFVARVFVLLDPFNPLSPVDFSPEMFISIVHVYILR